MKVELLGSLGTDLDVVNAARVSLDKESSWDFEECQDYHYRGWDEGHICQRRKILSERDRGLLAFLVKNRHGTPFEMVQFKFRVTCPIGVAREWFRHRIASYNEQSTRYDEMEPVFYVPEGDAIRTQTGKPGAYKFETMPEHMWSTVQATMHEAYRASYEAYQELLSYGVAKEVARNVLPLGLQTKFITSINLRSLFNFLSLRNAPQALHEIRLLAEQVEEYAVGIVPVSMEMWNINGRVPI